MAFTAEQARQNETVSRRDFLRVGSLGVMGLSVAEQAALARQRAASDAKSCIFVLMTGGASQFETFDPKPDAPAEIRGPMRAISTATPGTILSESLPRLAERSERFAIVRSFFHEEAPVHETGQQLLQAGRLVRKELRSPSFGSVIAQRLGARNHVASYVVLPRMLEETGVSNQHGQSAGNLGHSFDPLVWDDNADDVAYRRVSAGEAPAAHLFAEESELMRRMYGESRFGYLCLQARKLVERGVRCVALNLFDALENQLTWDCHGLAPWAPATLFDYRDTLCPQFDHAFAGLLDDLSQRGMLDDTLVVAVGEMGRTPRVNQYGGRDHWTGVWSGIVAGCGTTGGAIVGASDAHGTAPVERPVHPGELTATIFERLGLDAGVPVKLDDAHELPLVDHAPIAELFA
ncbi:MAG: DUF1501 domain-containing protein [Planctomycetaceae bacterium]